MSQFNMRVIKHGCLVLTQHTDHYYLASLSPIRSISLTPVTLPDSCGFMICKTHHYPPPSATAPASGGLLWEPTSSMLTDAA